MLQEGLVETCHGKVMPEPISYSEIFDYSLEALYKRLLSYCHNVLTIFCHQMMRLVNFKNT